MRKLVRKVATASVLSLLVSSTQAGAFCFDEAGAYYQISPEILRAISKLESGNDPSIIHWNKNGSYDVGLMGINSCHADELGPQRWSAMRDPCTNVMTGAWLLRQCFNKYGYNWQGVGCFNSQTPVFRDKYAREIYNIMIQQPNGERKATVAARPTADDGAERGKGTWEQATGIENIGGSGE